MQDSGFGPGFEDEELMAYADGELDEERAMALDRALAEDEVLAERLALFLNTRAIASDAFAAALKEPVPDHLIQRVRDLAAADAGKDAPQQAPADETVREMPADETNTGDTVVAFPPPRAAPAPAPLWRMPLAAGIALAAGLGLGFLLAPQTGSAPGGIEIARLSDPQIISALDTVPSGDKRVLDGGARVVPIATFFDGADTLCREFEFDRTDGITVVSVACHRAGAWDVQLAIAAASADETGYAPASSLDALNAYLAASEAGAPLDPDAEAEALAGLR